LEPVLKNSRLDIQWGSAGEYWRIAGRSYETSATQRFEALAYMAGEKLRGILVSTSHDPEGIATEVDPIRLWYKGIWKIARIFEYQTPGHELDKDGKIVGTIHCGSINKIADASATFCLELAARYADEGVNGSLIDKGREKFFPKGSQYDAYVKIRELFRAATKSIVIIDPYLDETLFPLLLVNEKGNVNIKLLTFAVPPDFSLETRKFLEQHSHFNVEIRRSKEFHDRFIIIDDSRCFHIGASIKDAGARAFMISEVEDELNKNELIKQLEAVWNNALPIS
jgi:hypothetical protein